LSVGFKGLQVVLFPHIADPISVYFAKTCFFVTPT
jgi:hypothetical protein